MLKTLSRLTNRLSGLNVLKTVHLSRNTNIKSIEVITSRFDRRNEQSGVTRKQEPWNVYVDSDFSGKDFTYFWLSNSIFIDCDFSDTILMGTHFDGSILIRPNLNNADLDGAGFDDTTFIDSDFTKVKNKRLKLVKLMRATLIKANLSGLTINGVSACYSNLTGADLSGCSVKTCSIRQSDFTNADISNVDFEDMLGIDEACFLGVKKEGLEKVVDGTRKPV